MWRITTSTATVMEVHRFINTASRTWERPVCQERRELWLGTGNDEYKSRFTPSSCPQGRRIA